MPRDASGNYTLPPENPVVSGTIITSDWANSTMPDLGNEITGSLSRQGEGGMLAPLKHVQGSALLPSLTFLDDIQSGLYLSAVADVRMSIAGADVMRWTAGDVNVWDGAQWVDIPTGDEIQANYLALDASNFPTRIRFSEQWAAQESGGLLDFYPSDTSGIPTGGAKLNLQLGTAIESRMTLLADSGFTVLTAGDQSFDFVSATGSQQGGFHYDDTNRFWVRTTTGEAIFDTESPDGGGEFQITSRVNGNTIVIRGLNGAGNERRVFDADPDAGAQLYFGANAVMRTVVNSSGGLEVNGGSGFERVLIESDAKSDEIENQSFHTGNNVSDALNQCPDFSFLNTGNLNTNPGTNFVNEMFAQGVLLTDPDTLEHHVTLNIKLTVDSSGSGDDVGMDTAIPAAFHPAEMVACTLTQIGNSTNMYYIHADLTDDGFFTVWQESGPGLASNGTYTGTMSFLVT